MDVKGMPEVDQAEGHAPGCDGNCGAEAWARESIDRLRAAREISAAGAPTIGAMLIASDPMLALFVLTDGDPTKIDQVLADM